ncbi:MAG TPA: integrase arm-type DNA-binding domain-containing protein [Alphaproteobacteria bacterium]|nr:integrase arm-type DNA-binding domain-containing protein [Alphaproteobacteria bacterium]
MPKRIIPLSDMKVQKAKSKDKPVTLFDGGGLFLMVTPTGGKLWRFKYRFDGKEKKLAFGSYPEISLLDARKRRDEARSQIAHGIDPGAVRKAQKQAKIEETETFEIIAREWQEKFKSKWQEEYADKIMRRMELNVFPLIGLRPIKNIKAPELLAVLRRVESRDALELAHRIRNLCDQIFRYAVATGRTERNPAADLKGALIPVKEKHRAAITDPKRVGELLRAIDSYQGTFVVQCALKFAPLVFVRPGELRHAEWSEINFENAEWNIPASKMKMKEAHLVPLSRQAIEILRKLHTLTGTGRYVFPSERSSQRPMSENAILVALRIMGYPKEEMSGHGFRAMARTILDEVLQIRPDFIEHQLAHAVRDPNGRAYNRTAHINERRKMMQKWADYLDDIKQGAKVLPFRKITK